MAKNLLDQLHPTEVAVVGLLVGIDTAGPSFRNYLRDMPEMPGDFTMGDVARAYLAHRLSVLAP